jgi:hypothetical protein
MIAYLCRNDQTESSLSTQVESSTEVEERGRLERLHQEYSSVLEGYRWSSKAMLQHIREAKFGRYAEDVLDASMALKKSSSLVMLHPNRRRSMNDLDAEHERLLAQLDDASALGSLGS